MRRRTLLATVAVAVLMLVVVVRGCGSDNHTEPERTISGRQVAASATGGQPAARHQIPVRSSRDADGARAAAVAAVEMTGTIARAGFITRGDLINELASTEFGPILVRQSVAQIDELLGELPTAGMTTASVLFREMPLTASVVRADTATARVEVWSLLVVGAPDTAPRQLWRTVSVELVWERDNWRIDGWTATPGPTPALATNASIATVDELTRVASWSPARGS